MNYAYKSYLETIFSFGSDASSTHLKSSYFEMDTPDNYEKGEADNTGAKNRSLVVDHPLHFSIPLHADVFQISRYLPPHTVVKVILSRQRDEFSLFSLEEDTDYMIEFQQLRIRAKYINANQAHMNKQTDKMSRNLGALYPIQRTVIKTSVINKASTTFQWDNLLSSIPTCLVIGMVDSDSYNGMLSKNSFLFKHNGVKDFKLVIDGHRTPVGYPLTTWTEGSTWHPWYNQLTEAVLGQQNAGNCITPEHFIGGSTLFVFDMTPDNCLSFHRHEQRLGQVNALMEFSAELAKPTTVIAMAIYQDEISLFANKQVVSSGINFM